MIHHIANAIRSQALRFAPCLTKRNLITLAVAASLCVYWFFLMLPQMDRRSYDDNTSNVYLFAHMSRFSITDTNLAARFPAWQPRVVSQMLAGRVLDLVCPAGYTMKMVTWNGYKFGYGAVAFGIYQSAWLALTFLAVLRFRPDAILVIPLVYAGLTYNLTIPSGSWFFPWDMPSMCLFTWAYLTWEAGRVQEFFLAAFLACLFKETGVVLCLFPLLNRRWISALALVAAGYAGRAFFMQQCGVSTIALPWNNATGTADFFIKLWSQLGQNLTELLAFHLNSFFFAGCGLLVPLFFLNAKWQTKAVAGAFIAGQFGFGYAHEFREWEELLPLAACLASDNLRSEPETRSPA